MYIFDCPLNAQHAITWGACSMHSLKDLTASAYLPSFICLRPKLKKSSAETGGRSFSGVRTATVQLAEPRQNPPTSTVAVTDSAFSVSTLIIIVPCPLEMLPAETDQA